VDHLIEQAHNFCIVCRTPSPTEVAAAIVFHDRYVAHRTGGPIEFWRTLTAAEQDWIVSLVRAVGEAAASPDPTWPHCPKRCDVATRPEYVGPGRWVCEACGTEFSATVDAEPAHLDACGLR